MDLWACRRSKRNRRTPLPAAPVWLLLLLLLFFIFIFIFIFCFPDWGGDSRNPLSISSKQLALRSLDYHTIIAGLPRARSARGTEPHTHGIWSTSLRLVVTWLTKRARLQIVRVGLGRVSKGREGCLSRVLASPHLAYWTFTKWSIDSCQNRIATDQYHMSISRAHVSTHRGDVIYLEVVPWPEKLTMHTYWTSMLWSIDSCQNSVSADQYHLTVLRAHVSTHWGRVIFWSYPLTSY